MAAVCLFITYCVLDDRVTVSCILCHVNSITPCELGTVLAPF